MRGAYLLALMVSLAGLATIDWRYHLAFWRAPRRAAATLATAVAVFAAWDLAGIGLGIFFIGTSPLLTGWRLAPEFPIEELFFLCLLCYVPLLMYTWRKRA